MNELQSLDIDTIDDIRKAKKILKNVQKKIKWKNILKLEIEKLGMIMTH